MAGASFSLEEGGITYVIGCALNHRAFSSRDD